MAQAAVVVMRAGRSAENLYMCIYVLMIVAMEAADKWGEGCRKRRELKRWYRGLWSKSLRELRCLNLKGAG